MIGRRLASGAFPFHGWRESLWIGDELLPMISATVLARQHETLQILKILVTFGIRAGWAGQLWTPILPTGGSFLDTSSHAGTFSLHKSIDSPNNLPLPH
jgi:hypothetical protein